MGSAMFKAFKSGITSETTRDNIQKLVKEFNNPKKASEDLRYNVMIAYGYITLFSLITQSSSKLADAERNTIVNVSSNYQDVYVKDISNDLLWNCRPDSPEKSFYKAGFILLFCGLLISYIVTVFYMLLEGKYYHWSQAIRRIFLKISFVFALTTYDVSIWGCICGGTRITYNEETQKVDLHYTQGVATYQLTGSILSYVFILLYVLLWWLWNKLVVEKKEKLLVEFSSLLKLDDILKDLIRGAKI